MNATQHKPRLSPELHNVLALAALLERLEHSLEPVAPAQYQAVAQRLAGALRGQSPSPVLQAILAAHPPAAEVYENVRYEHAGLCLAPLDAATQAELRTREALDRVAARREPLPPAADVPRQPGG
jgi:hypothetical protein